MGIAEIVETAATVATVAIVVTAETVATIVVTGRAVESVIKELAQEAERAATGVVIGFARSVTPTILRAEPIASSAERKSLSKEGMAWPTWYILRDATRLRIVVMVLCRRGEPRCTKYMCPLLGTACPPRAAGQ